MAALRTFYTSRIPPSPAAARFLATTRPFRVKGGPSSSTRRSGRAGRNVGAAGLALRPADLSSQSLASPSEHRRQGIWCCCCTSFPSRARVRAQPPSTSLAWGGWEPTKWGGRERASLCPGGFGGFLRGRRRRPRLQRCVPSKPPSGSSASFRRLLAALARAQGGGRAATTLPPFLRPAGLGWVRAKRAAASEAAAAAKHLQDRQLRLPPFGQLGKRAWASCLLGSPVLPSQAAAVKFAAGLDGHERLAPLPALAGPTGLPRGQIQRAVGASPKPAIPVPRKG